MMKHKNYKSKLFDIFNMAFFILLAFIMIYPLWNVLMTSLVDAGEFYSKTLILWPKKFYFDSYKYIFSGQEYIDSLSVTIFTTVVGSIYSLILTTTLAYGLSKKYLPGKNFFLILITLTMFYRSGLIPFFLLIRNLGLMNSLAAVILPSGVVVFYFIVIKAFFSQVPVELEESAKIDGANDILIFVKIVLPISTSVLATFFLFYAVIYWNQWYHSLLFIQNRRLRPMQLVVREMVVQASEYTGTMGQSAFQKGLDRYGLFEEGVRMGAVIVVTVPILIVYPFLQKYFAKGVTLGSVKG